MTEPKRCPQCDEELPTDAPMGLCPKCVLKVGVESRQGTQAEEGSSRAAFVPPEPAELAEHFPQLEVLELLGQGGMGAVYKARQPSLDRLVALKILRPNLGDDPTFAERFAREARSLARLNHPNIVGVYDFGQAGGFYYFLMEYVDGVNLRQMEGREPLPAKEALAIVPQICDALQFAHDEGIVHRDIKPENILIDTKGRVKIADFGLAKLLARGPTDVTLTQPQQVMGTPHYMAPEQIETPAAVDQRADIYSLGVVFYELLTGELPIGRFAPPSQKVEIDVRLDEVVLKTLQKEPERRYQQASEVKTDVESIATGPPVGAPPVAGQADAPRPADVEAAKQRVRGPATGLLVVGILNCLLVVLLVILPIVLYLFFQGTRETLSHPPHARSGLNSTAERLESVPPVRGQRLSGSTFVPSAAPPRRSSELTLAPVAMMVPRAEFGFGAPLFVVFFILVLVMYIPTTVFIILGATKMRKLQSYGLATVGSIAAMLPCTPAFLIGLPIGIWALWALTRPEVKAAFGHKRGRKGGGPGGAAVSHAVAAQEKEPDQGYQQASEVKTDVESIATGPPVGAPPVAGQADAPRPADVEAAKQRVQGPATGLLVVGILNCLLIGLLVILPIVAYHFFQDTSRFDYQRSERTRLNSTAQRLESVSPVRGQGLWGSTFVPSGAPSRFSLQRAGPPSGEGRGSSLLGFGAPLMMVFFILVLVMYIPITVLIILGATKMRKLESYGLATVAGIAAMLPCTPAFLIGLPIGIWALWALTRPEVKAAFAHKRGRKGHGTGGAVASHEAAAASPAEQRGGPEPVQEQTGETDTDVKTEQIHTNGKSKIGKISLILAIGGVVLPIAVMLLLVIFAWLTASDPPYVLCSFLSMALEIAALVTGIIGRRSACGKAGLIISVIMLVLAGILALMFVAPSGRPSRVRMEYEVTMAPPGVGGTKKLALPPATKPATKVRELPKLTLDLGNGVTMKLVLIPAGKFMMGSAENAETLARKNFGDGTNMAPLIDIYKDEHPQHEVTITKPSYMGVTEVTQEQYVAVVGRMKSSSKGPKNPMVIWWKDAVAFCKALSKKTGKTVRLPTEAEWEYACRAGTKTAFCSGDDQKQVGDYAWHAGNSESKPQPVAQKKPNAWGLYDMHGNVSEWCSDWYADSYANAKTVDPQGAASKGKGARSLFRQEKAPDPFSGRQL